MTSLETPKTWIPYVNSRDCSQGFCTLYCPQWCYIIFPPPPPPKFDEFPDIDNSTPTFSPLMIAIIGILASAFLLITYYTIISKYCGKSTNDSRIARNQENQEEGIEEIDHNHNPSIHEPWIVSSIGLDEALIKKITMCKYNKGDGLIEGTDCSVCLNEFQEDESLRLLPKCSHAFHVSCIDTWLRSHSNCPLCRANIVFISSSLPPNPPSPVVEGPQSSVQDNRPSSGSDVVIEIVDDERRLREQRRVRRSYSMDNPCFERRASIADVLRMNDEEELSSSEEGGSEARKSRSRRKRRGLNGVISPVLMKRSLSSGRFSLTGRSGRVRDTVSMCIV
ncbi:RING/U-box superfamily protein [Euphorbia peplus]|nr:RING/U-box superfamily protein [Euphorbia peplus]